jgi:hypothetical protein
MTYEKKYTKAARLDMSAILASGVNNKFIKSISLIACIAVATVSNNAYSDVIAEHKHDAVVQHDNPVPPNPLPPVTPSPHPKNPALNCQGSDSDCALLEDLIMHRHNPAMRPVVLPVKQAPLPVTQDSGFQLIMPAFNPTEIGFTLLSIVALILFLKRAKK